MTFQSLGFKVWQTGGGCRAWGRGLSDGSFLMVTHPDGGHLPDRDGAALLGHYANDNDDTPSMREFATVAELLTHVSDLIATH